jgi:NADPH2:quinone reductase
LHPAEFVKAHGGAGGVGSIAIRSAKAMGATAYTTCKGSDTAFVRALRADHAIDFTRQDYVQEIADPTGKKARTCCSTRPKERRCFPRESGDFR